MIFSTTFITDKKKKHVTRLQIFYYLDMDATRISILDLIFFKVNSNVFGHGIPSQWCLQSYKHLKSNVNQWLHMMKNAWMHVHLFILREWQREPLAITTAVTETNMPPMFSVRPATVPATTSGWRIVAGSIPNHPLESSATVSWTWTNRPPNSPGTPATVD